MNVLIIDNNPEFALSLKDMLQRESHQAVVVGDGQSGLRLAATRQFDVILLDIVMPGESGISFLLAAHQMKLDTPVVAMDALFNHRINKRVAELGAADFLKKPVSVSRLRAVLAGISNAHTALHGSSTIADEG